MTDGPAAPAADAPDTDAPQAPAADAPTPAATAEPAAPAGDGIPSAQESAEAAAARQAADPPASSPPAAPATPEPEAVKDESGAIDLDAVEVNEVRIKLGGKTFIGREASVRINKEIARLLPESSAKGDDENLTPQEQLENLDAIYPQLALLLRDPDTGKPPDQAFIEEHLTTPRLRVLMKALNPKESEGNAGA
jgi:hypothetical protein